MSRRHLLIAFILVTTIAVAIPNEITNAGYLDVRDSECWDCHTGDDIPLREMFEVVSSETTSEIGEQFAYEVRVENSWVAELIRLEGGLNIANAPSLGFSSVQPPELGDVVRGTIPVVDYTDTANINEITQVQSAVVVGYVDAGVTDLKITLTPENTDPNIGPQLEARIFPGRTTPSNQPAFNIEADGPGQSAVLHLESGQEIAEEGFGSWALEVRTTPVGVGGSPSNLLSDIKFSVTFDKYYNVTGENVQFLSRTVNLEAGQSTAFGWILVAQTPPGPGEFVTVNMNTTSLYIHDASSYPDHSYIHRNFNFAVSDEGGLAKFEGTPQTGAMQNLQLGVSVTTISEAIGYISAFLLVASVYTGGMFGKATRRQQNKWFGSAKRRVAFHNFLSYGIVMAALIHTVLFISPWENSFHWTNGLIWGGIGLLALFALGVTGAIQVPMIRKWNYATWRWTHFGLAIAAIVFTLVHMFLDGSNLSAIQDVVEWKDPFDPRV